MFTLLNSLNWEYLLQLFTMVTCNFICLGMLLFSRFGRNNLLSCWYPSPLECSLSCIPVEPVESQWVINWLRLYCWQMYNNSIYTWLHITNRRNQNLLADVVHVQCLFIIPRTEEHENNSLFYGVDCWNCERIAYVQIDNLCSKVLSHHMLWLLPILHCYVLHWSFTV